MSFGAIADDYDRLRPGPPEAAVDWLLPARCLVAVDLGAGTGLLTRALARRVAHVIAVEPDERMTAVLRARSAGPRYSGIRVVPGQGEAIPVRDAGADGVFVSSAWHWLDPGRAIPEIARVLRDRGRLGVIWTNRDREAGWFSEFGWFRQDNWFRRSDPSPAAPDHGETGRDEALRSRRREITLPDALFGPAETQSFAFTRTMTVSDILGMLTTYSGVITASPLDRAAGLARARAALEQRFPGASEIDVPMRAWCWRADRAPR
jgi:SAM-dependent methyltransferase